MVEARYYCQRSPRDTCCQNLGAITSGTNSGNGSNGNGGTTPTSNNLTPTTGVTASPNGPSTSGAPGNTGNGNATPGAGNGNSGTGTPGNTDNGNSGNTTANGNTNGNSTAPVAPGQPGNGTGLPQNPDGAPLPSPPAIMPIPSGLPGQEGGNSSTTGSANATDPNLPAAPQEQQGGINEVFKKNQTVIIIASVLGAALIFFIGIAWAYRRRNRVASDAGSIHKGSVGSRSSMGSSIRSGATGIVPGSLVNAEGHAVNENAVLVVRSYQPNLSDEISLKIGDTVKIIEPYDDGMP